MAVTDTAQRQAALSLALAALDRAAGSFNAPDWDDHAKAVPDAVAALSALYMHTDALTGESSVCKPGDDPCPTPFYLDRTRVVFGLVPITMAPLLELLEEQTLRLMDWQLSTGKMPASSQIAMARWGERLAYYKAELAAAMAEGPTKPSERLWTNVTAPLLQGIYTPMFKDMGIVNPAVRSKPDVVTPAVETFVVALGQDLVGPVQQWLLGWGDQLDAFRQRMADAIQALVDNAGDKLREELIDPLITALKWAGGALAATVLVALGIYAYQATRNREPQRKALRA